MIDRKRPRLCKYCAEEADVLVRGWYTPPPDETLLNGDARPDLEVAACTLHRTTAKLRVTSVGYPFQTEFDLTTVWNPNFRPQGDGST